MDEKRPKLTTIALTLTMRDRIAEVGRKRETYDDILKRVFDFYEEHHVNTRL